MKKSVLLTLMGLSLALGACDDDSGGSGGFGSCYIDNGQFAGQQYPNDPYFNNRGGNLRYEYEGYDRCWDYATNNYADINACHSCSGQGYGQNDFRRDPRGYDQRGYNPGYDQRRFDPRFDPMFNDRRRGFHPTRGYQQPYGYDPYGRRYL